MSDGTYKVEIIVKDVAEGDIVNLCESIMEEHGEEFDAPLGDFTIRVLQQQGPAWFEVGGSE